MFAAFRSQCDRNGVMFAIASAVSIQIHRIWQQKLGMKQITGHLFAYKEHVNTIKLDLVMTFCQFKFSLLLAI